MPGDAPSTFGLAATSDSPEGAPSLPLMHAAFVLAGFGTLLLGPILPLLATRWHMNDSGSGQLLLAQFCGATLGGATTTSRLTRDLMLGLIAAALGFFAFAFAPSLPAACLALVSGGFGVGRLIATVNIIAGNRYTEHRASSLARLNFTWSFGALLSPVLAAALTPRFALPRLLASFAALFALVGLALARELVSAPRKHSTMAQAPSRPPLELRVFLHYLALLFVYGGLETCLSGWLTTYALRYGQSSLVLSEGITVLLLVGLTAGRALAAWMLLTMRDSNVQRASLVLSGALAASLAAAHQVTTLAILAVLLGVSLAPIFPATFAMLMVRRPTAQQAGIVLAASGLGAAALPWLMGVVSARVGSLQLALAVPVLAAVAMFAMTLLPPRPGLKTPSQA